MADTPARKTIPGKGTIPGWKSSDVVIEVLDPNYIAYDKPLRPSELPARTRNNEKISWFNNFGVRRKDRRENAPEDVSVPEYRVYLAEELPDDPQGGRKRRLCAYYDGQVHEITPTPAGPNAPGRFMFNLKAGDPPTGTIP